MQVSIIIPTKDRGEVFSETLRCAVAAVEGIDGEIIVVNDSKSSKPTISSAYKNVTLINNEKSGVASARNIGVKKSSGELLLFLDDDIVISKNSLMHVLQLHKQMENICLNVNWEYPIEAQMMMEQTQFGRFMKAHQLTSFKGWYAHPSWIDNSLFQSTSVASFHLTITRSNFNKTSGYNEQFPHAGFEDYDFPLQLKKAGLTFYIDSRITVFHNEADRLKITNWMDSQERRAHTRGVAVRMGYRELELRYGLLKKMTFGFIAFGFGWLLNFLSIIPNKRNYDPLYFKIVGLMQAVRIYKGYTK
jgi:glycosyltransferase involved in cell wall biosynthesis